MSNSHKVAQRRAAIEAAEAAARISRARRIRVAGISAIAVVIVVVVSLVLVSSFGKTNVPDPAGSSAATGTPVPAHLIERLQSVPLGTLAAASETGVTVSPDAIEDAKLESGGKPELLYIGAEFCPICATERWAMYVALSKFGTFTPQPGEIHSSVTDGDIETLTFYKTKFFSRYLTFTPVETTTNEPDGGYYVSLQNPTPAQMQLWRRHTSESFPWLDFGGEKELSSAQYDPSVLEGLTFDSIAGQVGDNSTVVGADVDASAEVLVHTICDMLPSGNRPLGVCKAFGK